ncbi:hypothetical protein ACFFX0_26625 [Citricoccus parietis]|uniref:Uncharacterized protein n=1 Tax=Citricoccus parietis TaxID=592307 RepID=A0ABV5G6J9_9MICC
MELAELRHGVVEGAEVRGLVAQPQDGGLTGIQGEVFDEVQRDVAGSVIRVDVAVGEGEALPAQVDGLVSGVVDLEVLEAVGARGVRQDLGHDDRRHHVGSRPLGLVSGLFGFLSRSSESRLVLGDLARGGRGLGLHHGARGLTLGRGAPEVDPLLGGGRAGRVVGPAVDLSVLEHADAAITAVGHAVLAGDANHARGVGVRHAVELTELVHGVGEGIEVIGRVAQPHHDGLTRLQDHVTFIFGDGQRNVAGGVGGIDVRVAEAIARGGQVNGLLCRVVQFEELEGVGTGGVGHDLGDQQTGRRIRVGDGGGVAGGRRTGRGGLRLGDCRRQRCGTGGRDRQWRERDEAGRTECGHPGA